MYLDTNEDCGNTTASSGNIRTAAIIGAGLSGIVSAVHLLRAGINVTIFERAGSAGGAWAFSPHLDQDPPFPTIRPPTPDWDDLTRLQQEGLGPEEAERRFSPPGPVYVGMKSRGSEKVMRTSLKNWPEGTLAPIDNGEVLAYLQDIARIHSVEDKIRFRTRVEEVWKDELGGDSWYVRTSRLVTTPTSYAQERESWKFDAVVVATGRYGVPRVPDVPGLPSWKREFPSRVTHSKQYRTPTPYSGKTVLLIGAFISAQEIANELVASGAKVYESANDTRVDFRTLVDHENAESVAMVASFSMTVSDDQEGVAMSGPRVLDDDSPIPGKVFLRDGRVLEGIHHVVIATGYITTFPFLGPLLEQPSTAPENSDEKVVITADGRTVHNLHEDIFYIPDPTLAFIGITHFASTFSLYDFQAQVLAAVFANRVRLPPETAMRVEQRHRKSRVLPGTLLNTIFLLDDFVIRRLLDWVNGDLTAGGFEPLPGPDLEWWEAFRAQREGARGLLGVLQDNYLGTYGADWEDCDGLCETARAAVEAARGGGVNITLGHLPTLSF